MPYTAALRVLNSAIQEGSTPSIAKIRVAILNANLTLEWRNWQTHGTQNPASFTGYEGSTPSSSTNDTRRCRAVAAHGPRAFCGTCGLLPTYGIRRADCCPAL